ncbi:MAG: TolB family protein, partial [Chloroflexota bacterium]
ANAAGEAEGTWAIMVMTAEGEEEQILTAVQDFPAVGWSPDSQQVLYSTLNGTYAHNLASGASTYVVNGYYPVWSPDETRMAYLSREGCDPDVIIAAADGSDPRRVYRFTHTRDERR